MSKGNMEIRKSTREDIKQIMAIFTTAKEYMAAHGNKTQWGDGYPGEEILKTDIDAGNSYVIGIARACFEYCIKQIDYIRIDTHKDNISMQTAIERFGFHKCGNIYVKGDAERIAYDYIFIKNNGV